MKKFDSFLISFIKSFRKQTTGSLFKKRAKIIPMKYENDRTKYYFVISRGKTKKLIKNYAY